MIVTTEHIVIESINELRNAAIECGAHDVCEGCTYQCECSTEARTWKMLDEECFTPIDLKNLFIEAMRL